MQIYVLMPATTDFPYVFVSRDDAEAFSLARWPEDDVDIEEQTIIDHALARQMIAEERDELAR